ncbi:hypothetical protein JTB14_025766 [Gonioctena quinquepunctata]|nr:hypothetical protein JTB14_025766 [Gonioctena quinquepunctata]
MNGMLKSLSVNCKFEANLEFALKNKFVCGLRKGKVLDRICKESSKVQQREMEDEQRHHVHADGAGVRFGSREQWKATPSNVKTGVQNGKRGRNKTLITKKI